MEKSFYCLAMMVKRNNLKKKIDELNQETDILLEELDKWET